MREEIMKKNYAYTGIMDKNDTEIKVGDVVETRIGKLAVGKIVIDPFGQYVPGSFSYTTFDDPNAPHYPLSVLLEEESIDSLEIVDSVVESKCYTMEARNFEKRLNDIGIAYNQFLQLRKIWNELTLAAQAEVNDLLQQYED